MLRHAIVLAGFTACATSALADPTFISFKVDGASFTEPASINSAGDVAGSYSTADFSRHGFVRLHEGTIQSFDAGTEAKAVTNAARINDSGVIAGTVYFPRKRETLGFLRSPNGTIKTFRVPGTDGIAITGLNNKGAITGSRYDSSTNITHGFVRKEGGAIENFDIPGATWTQPGAINDNGTIAGVYFVNDFPYRGFIRDKNGAITLFEPHGDSFFNVAAINNAETIAGNMLFDGGYVRAANGTTDTFKIRNHDTYVVGMNADGMVAGTYVTGRRQLTHGFLRTADGTKTVFDHPDVNHNTYPTAINDSGMITGDYFSEAGMFGFIRIP